MHCSYIFGQLNKILVKNIAGSPGLQAELGTIDCWLAYQTIESKEESSHICLLFRDFYWAQDLIVTFTKVFHPFYRLGDIAEEKKADFSFDLESQTKFL